VLEYFLIYRGIEDPDLARIIGEALNRREDMPNVIEKWMEAGREEGLKEGIQKSIEKFLLKTRLTPAEIASTLDVDLSWVLEIEKNLEKPSEDSAR
jgi:predicted transposase YdaD